MNYKPFKDKPISIDKNTWYYEEVKGVCVVREVRDKEDNLIQTEQFYIPWKRLLESLGRKYNIKIKKGE